MGTTERKPTPTMVRMSVELREAVKVRAAQERVTMQQFIDRAVAAALGDR